jgi:hypothetical protein
MGEGTAKNWWETVPGIMTGIAALITAIAGLIVALHQTGQFSREPIAPDAANPAISDPAPPRTSRPSASATPKRTARSEPSPQPAPARTEEIAIDRPSYAVVLPKPREFVIGVHGVTGRFTLLSVDRAPNTPESDALKVRVRVTGRGREGDFTTVRAGMFTLIPDGASPVRPERDPVDTVYAGKSADQDILFIIPTELVRATFRMDYFGDKADIPLDLGPPQEVQ